jgi:hypothetical protein
MIDVEEKKKKARAISQQWRKANLERVRQKNKEWWIANRDECIEKRKQYDRKNRDSIESKRKERRLLNPLHTKYIAIKAGAKQRGIPFAIKEEELPHIPSVCPILGIPLEIFSKDKCKQISLDRFDNSKGYVPGNVIWISHRANALKNDATLEELEQVLKYMKGQL